MLGKPVTAVTPLLTGVFGSKVVSISALISDFHDAWSHFSAELTCRGLKHRELAGAFCSNLQIIPPRTIVHCRAGVKCRCRVNMAHTRQPRPDSGRGFQEKALKFTRCCLFARMRLNPWASNCPVVRVSHHIQSLVAPNPMHCMGLPPNQCTNHCWVQGWARGADLCGLKIYLYKNRIRS